MMIPSSVMVMLAQSNTAEETGRIAGMILPLLLFSWGVAKCYIISNRPTTNRKCAFSLMFVLLAFLVLCVVNQISRVVNAPPVISVARVIAFISALILFATGFVLGIMGLKEMGRERERYVQGRRQAIWGISLSVFFTFIFCMTWKFSPARRPLSSAFPSIYTMPGQTIRFDDLNFSYRSPTWPWTRIDMSRMYKENKLSFMRQSPEAYVTVIAESLGADSPIDTEQLVEINNGRVESMASSTRILQKEPMRINDLNGILVLREAEIKGYQFFYQQWFTVTNGYAFQVMSYCKAADRPKVENELRGMLSNFSLLDTRRSSVSPGLGFTNNFTSPMYYYTVEVTNSAWQVMRSLNKTMPNAEFGASQYDSCLFVLPVWLGSHEIDADAVSAGLLASLNIIYPDEDLTRRLEINQNGGTGVQYDYTRDVNGQTRRYRLRILRQGQFAYLVDAWTLRSPEKADAVLNDAISRVHICAPTADTLQNIQPADERLRKAQAYFYNEAGLYYFKSEDYEKALPLFKAAADGQADDAHFLANVLTTLSRLERNKDGLDYLEAHGGDLQEKAEIRVFRAHFQAALSLNAEAITNYAEIFSGSYRNENDFKEYVGLLVLSHQYNHALEAVQKYLAAGDSTSVRLLTPEIYETMGRYEDAVKFLDDEHNKAPFNSNITRSLARTLLGAGKPTEALALCKELIKDESDSYAAYYLMARCEISLRWYKDAKATLETAARLEPSNKEVKDSLDYVSGLLGEGNNSMLKTPIDPVPLPDRLTNWPAQVSSGEQTRDFGCYYQRQIKALYYKPGSEFKTTEYLVIDVLDTTGVAEFSTYQTKFDPLGQDIYVNEARVSDAAGKILSTIAPSSCYVIDDPYQREPGGGKLLCIPFASLHPGCQISLVITKRSFGSLNEFPFLDDILSAPVPIAGAGIYLQGGGSGVNIKTSPEITREDWPAGLFFSITNPPVFRLEPLQSPARTYLPTIWMSDSNWPWFRLATNYLAAINDRLQPDEGVRDKARQLTDSLSDTNLKIAALGRYVQTNCVYKAVEFGRHSRTPNKAADTLHNSYGDCKDLSVLLQQLLQSAGINSYLTLVSLQNPVQTNLPSLDQFDHMVVAVSNGGAEKFIDCTARGGNPLAAVPPGLAGRVVLVLNPSNPHLTTVPAYSPDDSHCKVNQKVALLDSGDVSVDETISLTGTEGAFLRDYLLRISPGYRQESIQRDMGIADTKITHFEITALDDPGRTLEIKYTFILNRAFDLAQNGSVGRLRAGLERYYINTPAVAKRLSPFETTIPFQCDGDLIFDVPKGYRIVESSKPSAHIETPFLTFESTRRAKDGELRMSFHYTQSVGRHGPAEYTSYQQATVQVLDILDAEVALKKTGT